MAERVNCPICNKEFSKYGIKNHIAYSHEFTRESPFKKGNPDHIPWNKGLTKDSDERIKKAAVDFSQRCKSGNLVSPWQGKTLPEEMKLKISESMKKAHAEDRAWNIGKSRWNNEPSYPEKFFMQVIENEFLDKDYQREFPISIWSFDFAWPHLMKAIEIDGAQHERFLDYQERDTRKDLYATENGWQVLRISWKEFYKDTKFWINKAKEFLE